MQTGWNQNADFKIPKAFSCYLTNYQTEEGSTSCNPYSKWLPLNHFPESEWGRQVFGAQVAFHNKQRQ